MIVIKVDLMRQQSKKTFKHWGFSLLAALASLNLDLPSSAQIRPCVSCALLPKENNIYLVKDTAYVLFRNAYENRYTWGLDFPGYTATVEFKQDKDNYKGNVRVNPNLSVEVTGIKDEEVRQTVENQLRMNIVHRRQVPFEVAHKNSTFKLGTTDKTGSVEIFSQGDKTQAKYKIAERQIKQVNRMMGPHAVIVDTLESETTSEGYLATRYRTTLYHSQTKQALGNEETEDAYEKIGGYYILSRHTVQHSEKGNYFTAQTVFRDIQLLTDEK